MKHVKCIQVLLAEDGRPSRILMERQLGAEGRMVVGLRSGDELPGFLGAGEFDVLVQDLELPGSGEGSTVRVIRGSGPDAEVVILSELEEGRATQPADSEPYEYLTRPLTPSEIKRLAAGGDGEPPAPRRRRSPPGSAAEEIVGQSPAIDELLATVERVAASPASVHISGETGTGKGLVARAIHDASDRRTKPFVVVNCSAFQDQLLESELFGHEKGAFTGAVAAKPGLFEVAAGGTLFLDEVAEMSPAMQAKVLTVLDTRELRRVGGTKTRRVDVRIVTSTNKDLGREVKAGRFREDLLFRLKVISLTVPPLRERREDIAPLAEHFLARFHPPGRPAKILTPGALRLLTEYRWPGNVRELANTLEGLTLLAPGPEIRAEDLPSNLRPAGELDLPEAAAPLPMSEVERLHIARALRYTEGKKAPAARLLKIDVKTLNSKIRNYRIEI